MKEKTKHCSTCAFCLIDELRHWGKCHKNPPTIIWTPHGTKNIGINQLYPEMNLHTESSWCGGYEEKK
jgi:hypothetical protein